MSQPQPEGEAPHTTTSPAPAPKEQHQQRAAPPGPPPFVPPPPFRPPLFRPPHGPNGPPGIFPVKGAPVLLVPQHMVMQGPPPMGIRPAPRPPMMSGPWTSHRTPNGEMYYVNTATGQRSWHPPPGLSQHHGGPGGAGRGPPMAPGKPEPKPVSSSRVGDTPWLEVICDDGSKFWHNESTRQSSWEIPADIYAATKLDARKKEMLERAKAMGAVVAPEFENLGSTGGSTGVGAEGGGQEEDFDEDIDVTFTEEDLEEDHQEHQQQGKNNEEGQIAKQGTLKAQPPSAEQVAAAFKTLLEECGVHAFSRWERELPRFQNDARYKMVPPSERRKVFEEYCREAVGKPKPSTKPSSTGASAGTKASQQASKTNIKASSSSGSTAATESAFRALLKEHNVDGSSRWHRVEEEISKDERYTAVAAARRENIFRDYVTSLRKVEDARKEAERRGEAERRAAEHRQRQAGLADAIANYKTLLTETVRDPYASWREFQPRLERDPQGRATHPLLDNDILEDLFRDHTANLEDAAVDAFIDLLEEKLPALIRSQGGSIDEDNLDWKIVEEALEADARFHRLLPERKRESLWKRHVEDVAWNKQHPDRPPRSQRRKLRGNEQPNYHGKRRDGHQSVDRAYDREYLETDRKRIKR